MYRTGSEEEGGGAPLRTRIIFKRPVNLTFRPHSSSTSESKVSTCPMTTRSVDPVRAICAQALRETSAAARTKGCAESLILADLWTNRNVRNGSKADLRGPRWV